MLKVSTRTMPQWLNDVVDALKIKDENKVVASEKTAEVNVHDLPKVVWNDETFHVMFDTIGATVVNEFGNTVTTIKGASTIEAVDQHLNSKQITTSSKNKDTSILEAELAKVSLYLEADNSNNGQPQQDEFGGQQGLNQPADQNQQNSQTQQPTVPNNDTDQTDSDVNNLEQDVNQTSAKLELVSRLAAMESRLTAMSMKIEALSQQEYAHNDPGAIYDLNSEQDEENHYQESAQQSAAEIDHEHSVDLTTMKGRISLKDKILNDIDVIMNTDPNELDIPEGGLEEEEVELELPKEVEDIEEIPEIKIDDVPIDEEAPEPGTTEEIPVEIQDDEAEDKKDKSEDKEDEEKSDEPSVVKLNSRDSKIFKECICTECGEKKLVKVNCSGHMVGVYCKECETEYAVDTNTESIYKHSN